MVTGYIMMLQDLDYNTSKWLLEVIPRSMGVCVSLRDEPFDLTIAEIRKKLQDDASVSYYVDSIAEDKERRDTYYTWGKDEWESELAKEVAARELEYQESLLEYTVGKAQHERVLAEVRALAGKVNGECDLVANSLKFAEEQLLSTIHWDYSREPYKPRQWKDWQEFRDHKIETCLKSLAFEEKRLTEENQKTKKRLEMLDAYVLFVTKHLSGQKIQEP